LSNTIAEITRGQQLESIHCGSVILARADGSMLGIVGDLNRVVFPRSSIKIIQALPLVESGAADHFSFTQEELAFTCASHSGQPYHVALAKRLLSRLKFDKDVLACGSHFPIGKKANHDLISAGHAPSALHNNCSGKHLGMLATASFFDETFKDYELAHHEVQRRIKAALVSVTETDLCGTIPGIDGCSVPNWPLPLSRLAKAFARIVQGEGFDVASRNAAFARLTQACWAAPAAMAGEDRYDTRILERFAGDVFIKTGAEGVYCGGIRSAGIGFALKADDGATRAAEIAVGAIVARFVPDADDLANPLVLENAAGIAVGDIRPGKGLMSVLDRVDF